jgi:hypothetical protein
VLRTGLRAWGHAELHELISAALRWYGAREDHVDRRTARLLFLVDAYDELALNAAPASLPELIGMHEWPAAKLVVTMRRDTVPDQQLAARFGEPAGAAALWVRYLLPFTRAQIEAYMVAHGVPSGDAARLLASAQLRAIVENPFVLRLYVDCWRAVEERARTAVAGRTLRRHVYEASIEEWLRRAYATGGLREDVASRLLSREAAEPAARLQMLRDHFVAFAARAAYTMFSDDCLAMPADAPRLRNEPWLQLHTWTAESAEDEARLAGAAADVHAQLLAFRARSLQSFMADCPLQARDGHRLVTFAHKSVRDFLAALHISRHPDTAIERLVTTDTAVQRFLAEFVDPVETAAFANQTSGSPSKSAAAPRAPTSFGPRALLVVRASRTAAAGGSAVAAANCLTALNTAGVSFVGADLRGIRVGGEVPAAFGRAPFADLGGAMLAGADLSGASLANCRLQQACLDHVVLNDVDLTGAQLGERPAFVIGACVRAVAVSRDGRFVFTGGDDKRVKKWNAESREVPLGGRDRLALLSDRCVSWCSWRRQCRATAAT